MKPTQKSNRRLVLGRETIRLLKPSQLGEAFGGIKTQDCPRPDTEPRSICAGCTSKVAEGASTCTMC